MLNTRTWRCQPSAITSQWRVISLRLYSAGYFCHRLRRYNTQQAHLIIRAFECVDSTKSERVSQNFTLRSIVQNWWRGVHMFCEHTASHSICGDVLATIQNSTCRSIDTQRWPNIRLVYRYWQRHPLDFGGPFHVYEDFPRKRYLSIFIEKGYIGSLWCTFASLLPISICGGVFPLTRLKYRRHVSSAPPSYFDAHSGLITLSW